MSAQSVAAPGILKRWRENPNPVWLREMRQSARLTRTPFILATVTILTAVLLCSIGAIMATFSEQSATTGNTLYQTFFSLGFFVVSLAGSAVAANSIASEREGRTWEALQLTGLPPAVIARGKFLAAYTSVSLYIVALAPVGALPFLFGGVTATQVLLAFVWQFLLAALAVAFGLAISSRMESLRGALIVTMFATIFLAPILFSFFGPGMAAVIHGIWSVVPELSPIWLPGAYESVPFGIEYIGALILAPMLILTLPAWFLYEVTVANLTSITDDRSTRLRRWFFYTTAAMTAAGSLFPFLFDSSDTGKATMMSVIGIVLVLLFCAFVFAGEPIGPSQRVQRDWAKRGAGALTRAIGPGIIRASVGLILAGLLAVGLISFASLGAILLAGTQLEERFQGLVILSADAASLVVLVGGATAWLRAKTNAPGNTRILLLIGLVVQFVGPWLIALVVALVSETTGDGLPLTAAPSPFFGIIAAADTFAGTVSQREHHIVASIVCSMIWTVIGLALLQRASTRTSKIIRAHEAMLTQNEAMLRAEDDAQQAMLADESGAPAT